MKKIIVFNIASEDLIDFRNMALKAKKMGATHVMAAQMPRSRWMWEQDLADPYPNWSMGHAQLFKLVCPPELKEFLPQEHIQKCFELLRARCDILREIGLKPALFSNEPFWLPEEVYRKHPAWRGARCDHPRRSKKPYYSPCVDNPEVLSMYRYAVNVLCRETGIDFMHFMSNDSGGGLCWSSGTYAGPNGPDACRERSMADRVAGFLDALTEGCQHQRWINRPFVLFPMELAGKDREYYRKYQFQALTEEDANDLMNLQGIEGVRGFTAAFMVTETVKKAIRCLDRAILRIEDLREGAGEEEMRRKFTLFQKRLAAERCFYRNIIHAVRFQELADRTDFENPPSLSLRWPTRNDSRIEEFQNITRAEIDNTYELAGIIEDCLEEVILCTGPEKEDIFVYSTQFVSQLRRKAEIMLDHMNDGSRVYETHNI